MRWLFPMLALLAGCGRADLQIQLETISADDPYAGLTELSIVVRQGDVVVEQVRQPFESGAITLGPLDRTGVVNLTLAGYDDTGAVIARGEADPELPNRGATCCVNVCFCTVARFDAGTCTCGSKACRDC